LFKGISTRSKKVLASKSFYVKYPANSVILKQDEIPYNIYFVLKGSVTVLRRVDKDQVDVSELGAIFKKKHRRLKQSLLLQVEVIRIPFNYLR